MAPAGAPPSPRGTPPPQCSQLFRSDSGPDPAAGAAVVLAKETQPSAGWLSGPTSPDARPSEGIWEGLARPGRAPAPLGRVGWGSRRKAGCCPSVQDAASSWALS